MLRTLEMVDVVVTTTCQLVSGPLIGHLPVLWHDGTIDLALDVVSIKPILVMGSCCDQRQESVKWPTLLTKGAFGLN